MSLFGKARTTVSNSPVQFCDAQTNLSHSDWWVSPTRRVRRRYEFVNERHKKVNRVAINAIRWRLPECDIERPCSRCVACSRRDYENRILVDHDCPGIVNVEILNRSCLERLGNIHRRIQRTVLHRLFVVRHTSCYHPSVQVYPEVATTD